VVAEAMTTREKVITALIERKYPMDAGQVARAAGVSESTARKYLAMDATKVHHGWWVEKADVRREYLTREATS